MVNVITEDSIEQVFIQELIALGYSYLHGATISPDGIPSPSGGSQMGAEREFNEVVLRQRLQNAIATINPNVPTEAQEEALRKVLRSDSPSLFHNNYTFHRHLTEGVEVEYRRGDRIIGDKVWLIDYNNPESNEFLVVNQFTVIENNHAIGRAGTNKRPDVILFINGLPLVVIELKNAADEGANIKAAFNQLQTYKQAIPSLFHYNALLIASDGWDAVYGSLTSPYQFFLPWKSIDGRMVADENIPQMEVLAKGLLNRRVLLDLVRHFTIFHSDKEEIKKIIPRYHQYFAVNKAVERTISAVQPYTSPSQREGSVNYKGGFKFNGLLKEARELRKKQTPAEEVFWQIVRNKKFLGLKFRRQHQIGHYIVDFYCNEHKLIIELDGSVHDTEERIKKDIKRDKYLSSIGNKIIRFRNERILNDIENVLIELENIIFSNPIPPIPPSTLDTKNENSVTSALPSTTGAGGEFYLTTQPPSPTGEREGLSSPTLPPSLSEGRDGLSSPTLPPSPFGGRDGVGGNGRIGVIWHTQGSGKSLTMVFYAGKIVLSLNNPTLVVLTDRNDLDEQLFDTFSLSQDLLRQTPVQATDREDLKKRLKVSSGGIVFTTIQKFLPDTIEKIDLGNGKTKSIKGQYEMLSDRKNIVVIADEAHRSQYDFMDGFARHMRDALPNASFIGFTGTPIEKTDKNTQAVFGDYIDVYDIQQAVDDGATVRIYYENRLAKIDLKEEEKPRIDTEFEELTESEELTNRQKLKAKWARLEAIVGSEHRIQEVAKDLVTHLEQRTSTLNGKAMFVCMSRRICVELYAAIVKLRPEWHSDDDDKGMVKVVMTGSSSDPLHWQKHIRSKEKRKDIGNRVKDPNDPIKLVLVRDMWLTGFDAPCLHTLYIDKPMRDHNLMQAIARVNRVFKDKEGGLVVDYIGIASDLKKALSVYTESGGQGKPTFDQQEAAEVMMGKYEVVAQLFSEQPTDTTLVKGFDYKRFFGLTPKEKLAFPIDAANYILSLDNGKERYTNAVVALTKAFAISVPHPYTEEIRDEVALFQAIKTRIVKVTQSKKQLSDDEIDTAIRQILSDAIVTDEVVDIFDAAGLKKPDISILSDEFLAEVRGMKHKNLALELLKRLLKDEVKVRMKVNLVESRKFSEMLDDAVRRYQNNLLTSMEVIEVMIELAKEIKAADRRGEELGLDFREYAFYSALEVNDSAVKVLGDEVLRHIAQELVDTVRKNTSIDWTVRENVQAKMRREVKRLLRKHGYPPDLQAKATETVLEQAKMMADRLSETDAKQYPFADSKKDYGLAAEGE
ncbi:MAG: type I restriction endonuclease subunit R [Tenuifilaceae bacterium]|nr:type I restriction endonuclease subunit R [Tenuifilaceae bacterium]